MPKQRPAEGQLAFDLDAMIHEADVAAAPPWAGPAPLHFTVDYYSPADLTAAWDHWIFLHGHFDSHAKSHMWHPGTPIDPHGEANGHELVSFSVDLGCNRWKHEKGENGRPEPCACVGGLLDQAICEPCQWHVIGTEAEIIEAWHDHAWPGWRDLPVVPAHIEARNQGKWSKKALAWIRDNYPDAWQIEGAPLITDRGGVGTRHVPGYSPWGGFDISSTALDRASVTPPTGRRLPPIAGPLPAAARPSTGRSLAD